MKNLFSLILLTGLITLFSCKREYNKEMIVVKDCTGTYLRLDEKDCHVCNIDKLASYANGTKVTATFKKIENCTGPAVDEVVCYMLHKNEGWIEVLKVK